MHNKSKKQTHVFKIHISETIFPLFSSFHYMQRHLTTCQLNGKLEPASAHYVCDYLVCMHKTSKISNKFDYISTKRENPLSSNNELNLFTLCDRNCFFSSELSGIACGVPKDLLCSRNFNIERICYKWFIQTEEKWLK